MKIQFSTRETRAARKGLGDKVQAVIHGGLDAMPASILSPARKQALKECGGCHDRVQVLNQAERDLRRMLGLPTLPTPSATPLQPPDSGLARPPEPPVL